MYYTYQLISTHNTMFYINRLCFLSTHFFVPLLQYYTYRYPLVITAFLLFKIRFFIDRLIGLFDEFYQKHYNYALPHH